MEDSGEDMFWMKEHIFWGFTDYVHQHLDPSARVGCRSQAAEPV